MILVDDVDNRQFLCELVESMWEELPKKKENACMKNITLNTIPTAAVDCVSICPTKKSVNQIIHAYQQHRYDCRQSHCAYHSMDWRMGKKLIFFAHIVYFIAVCLHKTTAKMCWR